MQNVKKSSLPSRTCLIIRAVMMHFVSSDCTANVQKYRCQCFVFASNYIRVTAEKRRLTDGDRRGPISGTINLRLKLLISIQMLLFFPPCHTTNNVVHAQFENNLLIFYDKTEVEVSPSSFSSKTIC